jgi:hypothetical protein
MARFREISLQELQNESLAGGVTVMERRLLHGAAAVELPGVGFGCGEADLRARGKDEAAKTWGASRFTAGEVVCWTIAGPVVHGPYGVITAGGLVIRESLMHVPFGAAGYRRQDGIVNLPDDTVVQAIGHGWHAASGAYANYYHFLLDIFPKLQISPFAAAVFTGSLIMPPATAPFQIDAGALLARSGCSVVSLAAGESAAIGRLDFIANMTGAGFAPHPCLSRFFDRVAAAFGATAVAPRRLYISRAGAVRRRLANEEELIARLRPLGYEIFDPAGVSFREQMESFAAATHIVAPHGAGLANIVFCQPGTQLLELQMDSYMNLCFRKLAALRGLRYGCVVGDAEAGHESAAARHALRWSIETDRVIGALGGAD